MTWHEQNKEFNSLISQLFQAENWQERAEAARKLGILKDGRAVNLMCKALKKEKDKSVCNKIVEAMGKIGNPKATIIICEYLKKELEKPEVDKFSIIYIIESLTRLKDKRALVYIGTFLNSDDDEIRTLAEKGFDAIEPNWREILEREIKKNKEIEEIFKIKL
ncbi:MAG: HEAT repeat domain-containing protein [Promethearchaeota archaeon]